MSNLKKKTSNVLVWIIMLLLVAGLGGFGISNFGGSNAAMATVGKTDVTVNDYYRALNQELRSYQAQLGQGLGLSQAIASGLDRNVRTRLITQAALENEAGRIGLSVGDERVKSEVLASPAFQGIDGKFDRASYKQALSQAGLSETEYEAKIRAETARTLLQSAVVEGVAAPTAMVDLFVDFNMQRRDFSLIKLDQNDLPQALPEPSDAQLETYYKDNAARFTEPEKKQISYIWVTPDMIVDDIKISPEALQKEYDSRKDEFSSPETRLVERLVYPDEATAKAAKARLDAGEASFPDLVAERGLTLMDIDLGNVTADELKQGGSELFAMDAPGVIGPIATGLGPALFRMNGIIAAHETSLEELRGPLRAELAQDQARRHIAGEIDKIDDLLAGGATLSEVAAETDMQLGQIDWWPQNSDGIAGYSAFREAALAAELGDYAEVIKLDDGGIFALEFTKVIDPVLQPMDQVIAAVIAGWEAEQIKANLETLATDLQKQINEGTAFDALGYEVIPEPNMLRNSNLPDLPAALMQAAFEMDKGETRQMYLGEDVFLIQLEDIKAPDTENPDLAQTRDMLKRNISQALALDVFVAFNSALQQEAGVYINQAAVNAVHAQFPQ